MAASPIVFTSRTGGCAAASARFSKSRTTAPSSSAGTCSPSSVNPTMSTNATTISCAPGSRPLSSSARPITAPRICSRIRLLRISSSAGPASGARLRSDSA